MVSSASSSAALFSCLAYSFCSCTMVLSNKALATSFDANLPMLLVVFQCAIAVIMVEGSRRKGWVENYPIDLRLAIQWMPVNLFFCLMLYTSFMALKWVNVPMVTVFKNLTNVVIVWGDWFLYNQSVTLLIICSLSVMVLGAVLAGAGDAVSNIWGYTWMCLNCACTASYVLYMKYATRSIKLSKFGMVFYNNILGICMLLPVALVSGEIGVALGRRDLWQSYNFIAMNIFAGVIGFGLNFASLWCVGKTSATTYAIVGSINKVPLMLLGYFLFKSPISAKNAVYMGISLFGGFLYSWSKLKQSASSQADISHPKPTKNISEKA